MNLTKTEMRTKLGDDGGEIGEKHTMFFYSASSRARYRHWRTWTTHLRLITRWKSLGHLSSPSAKRKGATSVVLQRLARENEKRSRTCIATKPSSWQ